MTLTTDPNHPGLTRGGDQTPRPQSDVYLVLPEEELAKGYVKPYRTSYIHEVCGVLTRMGSTLSATYARDPWFYGATYCVGCSMHRPLAEFHWDDGEPMDPSKWPDSEHARIAALRDLLEPQRLNGLRLDQIMVDVANGASIERVDLGGYDGHEWHLVKGRYRIAEETIQKLCARGVLERNPVGVGYRKASVQTSAEVLPTGPETSAAPSFPEVPK